MRHGCRDYAILRCMPSIRSGYVLLAAVIALLGRRVDAATPAPCAQTSASWQTQAQYENRRFGSYVLSSDNFNGTPGQQVWAVDVGCWGAVTRATTERDGIGSYPHITRGWLFDDGEMNALSTPGTFDWTRKSGLGIPVTRLTKAKVRWAFSAPTGAGARWMALIDVYFDREATPNPKAFPPVTDLMIDQALMDQAIGRGTYYSIVASRSSPFVVTIGGVKYLGYIDSGGERSYHQAGGGGHTIHLFRRPTGYTDGAGVAWGSEQATTDVAAIVKYFMQSSPKDDYGRPIHYADGTVVAAPLIGPDLFLDAIDAGWEIDTGVRFETTSFWIALQNEPDGQ